MITPSNNLKYFRNEHKISHWLHKKGFNRKSIAYALKVDYRQLREIFKRPDEHLTIEQMHKISCLVQKPLLDVIFSMVKHPNLRREAKKRWYENTGFKNDYISKPE